MADPPALGQQLNFEAKLSEATPWARFRLVSLDGVTVQWIETDWREGSPTFSGQVVLQQPDFRIAVDGIDNNGIAFQRVYPSLIQTP